MSYFKQYYQNNKDDLLEKMKEYRTNNPDIMAKCRKTYYEKNKDKIFENQKQKRYCDCCDKMISKGNYSTHKKTKKHIQNNIEFFHI